MSESSDRGKHFELKVAAILRKKLGAKVMRDRRSGAGTNRADISDYYQSIPLHLELKDQETLKVKEWFRQAEDAASFTQAPTVVFAMDEEVLCCLRFSDLVNFLVEIADQKAEIDDLRSPLHQTVDQAVEILAAGKGEKLETVKKRLNESISRSKTVFCKSGHVSDQWGYCMQVKCPCSRGYKKPKGKKIR